MFNNNRLLKFRNTLAAIIISALALVSCGKDDEFSKRGNVLEFEKTAYSIPQSGEVIMKIVTTAPVTSATTVPFTLSGTAVKDTDYELSADAFVIPAGGKVGEVKVKAKASFDLNKSLKVNLGAIPSNVNSGNLLFTEVSIGLKDILIYTFESQNVTMTETADINLSLTAAEGIFVSPTELRIPVEVVKTGTTAVEGEHYMFDGPKEFVIPAGKLQGKLKLKFLKQEVGKTSIILKVKPGNNHYVAGNFNSTKVTIEGSNFNRIQGIWKFKSFSNLNWMILNSWDGDDETTLPKSKANDQITIAENNFSVQMTGDLKNYFRTATTTDKGEVTEVYQEEAGYPKRKMQIVQLSAVNVNFSPLKTKIRPAAVGMRVYVDSNGKDILEITIRDYEPTDFLAFTYENFATFGDDPVMKTMPLRFLFQRTE